MKVVHTTKLRSTLLTEDPYSVLARVSTPETLISESMRFKKQSIINHTNWGFDIELISLTFYNFLYII